MLTHAQRLERWLGPAQLQQLIDASRDFYWPVPVANTPGQVFAYKGDFFGPIYGGQEAGLDELVHDALARRLRREAPFQMLGPGPTMGFASLSDLISEMTGGKRQDFIANKIGTLAVSGAFESLWGIGNLPPAGAQPANLTDAGNECTRTTVGAAGQSNPTNPDTLHLITQFAQGSAGPNTLLLYDRIWHGRVNMNSAVAQSISNYPANRYTGAASKGNFAFHEVVTALAATAHNITITYTDQDGNAAEAAAAFAGIASAAATRIDHDNWFIPLNSPDVGLRTLTQFQLSAAVATGTANLVTGHPLAFLPLAAANIGVYLDGVNSMINLAQILDNACLAFLAIKGVASATSYNGHVILCAG